MPTQESTGKKPHTCTCTLCHKTFRLKRLLENHTRTQTWGESYNAICVPKHLNIEAVWNIIPEKFTMVSNHSSATYALRHLYSSVDWIATRELILEISHTFASHATKRFRIYIFLTCIHGPTLEQSQTCANYVIGHYHKVAVSETIRKHPRGAA